MNIPWHFIAITHSLEGGSEFTKHLHNGDPLAARTVNEPSRRPKIWNPPSTWEDSAFDALITLKKLDQWTDWSVPGILYKLEGYNGYGYHDPAININSPYLWSFSNHYTKGKFFEDHKYSSHYQAEANNMVPLKFLVKNNGRKNHKDNKCNRFL